MPLDQSDAVSGTRKWSRNCGEYPCSETYAPTVCSRAPTIVPRASRRKRAISRISRSGAWPSGRRPVYSRWCRAHETENDICEGWVATPSSSKSRISSG